MDGRTRARGRKWIVAVLLILTTALCACAGGREATPAPKPVSDLDFFEDIMQQRVDAVRVTDWEAYRDSSLIGKRVHWTGWFVTRLDAEKKGGPQEVRIDLEPPDSPYLHHFDVFFFLPPEQANAFTKDQKVSFQGDIKEIKEPALTTTMVLIVHLENVVIVE